MTYDPVQTTNTSGNFRFGFRDQFFYTSSSVADYSFHSRVAAADGSLSAPSVAGNTAIHDFTNSLNQYDHCRQGRMLVMWRTMVPRQVVTSAPRWLRHIYRMRGQTI